jgi:hypothetical protein
MNFFRILLISLILVEIVFVQEVTSQDYAEQINSIILFYETLKKKPSPTVDDFFKLFGKDNEAELKLILRQEYSSLDWKGNWFDNQEELNYVNKVYKDPHHYPSRFLQCIKSAEPKVFFEKVKHQIEFPPEISKDFRAYAVTTQGKKLIFEFSQDERTIENIYLPDGKSIYSLVEKCAKRNKEK